MVASLVQKTVALKVEKKAGGMVGSMAEMLVVAMADHLVEKWEQHWAAEMVGMTVVSTE